MVRGTTSRKIVRMVRNAGATEVHVRISCPPTDFAVLLRRGHAARERTDRGQSYSLEEIREYLEADSLAYLSLDSLRQAVADDRKEFCYACYTGDYPTELVQIEELVEARGRQR